MMNEGYFYCQVAEYQNYTALDRKITLKTRNVIYDNTNSLEIQNFKNLNAVIIKMKITPVLTYDCVNQQKNNIEM